MSLKTKSIDKNKTKNKQIYKNINKSPTYQLGNNFLNTTLCCLDALLSPFQDDTTALRCRLWKADGDSTALRCDLIDNFSSLYREVTMVLWIDTDF